MPTARTGGAFQDWQTTRSPVERQSITSLILDLNQNDWPRRDPDMYRLAQEVDLGSVHAPGLKVNVFIQPHRISSGVGRATRMWFGITQVAAGPQELAGQLLLLKAWLEDPGLDLVAAEQRLVALAGVEYP